MLFAGRASAFGCFLGSWRGPVARPTFSEVPPTLNFQPATALALAAYNRMKICTSKRRRLVGGSGIMDHVMTVIVIVGMAVAAVVLKRFTPLPFWACCLIGFPSFIVVLFCAVFLLSRWLKCKVPGTLSPKAPPKRRHKCSSCGRVYTDRMVQKARLETNPVFGMFMEFVICRVRWHCECGHINTIG
jgi:hypothetical protein